MEFWSMVYKMGVVDTNYLKQVVITDKNKFGDITVENFKEITGEEFTTQ